MRLILPVPPSWNRAYRAGQGRIYTPQSVIDFRDSVAKRGLLARVKKFPREQEVCVTIWWYRRRKQGDLGKRCETVLDALQGVWYVDDAQVAEEHLYRIDDPLNPRLEVEVTAIEQVKAA